MTASIAAGRQEARRLFLESIGWGAADLSPLQPDASFRSYARVHQNGEGRMLMDAPPERENLAAYLEITQHLRAVGLRVAKTFETELETGFALIEDMGDDTFTRLLDAGHDDMPLYLLATKVLKTLHAHPSGAAVDVPPYDMDALLVEAELFVDWFAPTLRGAPVPRADKQVYMRAWEEALKAVADTRDVLVLRDYHVDNLMIVGSTSHISGCGLLDYQDALLGARAYDLVSLVEDARRDVRPEVKEAVMALYCDGMSSAERTRLETEMAILGAQRHAKVAGIFLRLSKRDSKPIYLRHIPRVVRLMKTCLQHKALESVNAATNLVAPDYEVSNF